MPSRDWDDASDQDWEPVVFKTATRYYDASFVASISALRSGMRLDVPAFAARARMTSTEVRDFESGRLPFDTAVEHRLRALLHSHRSGPS